MPPQPSALENAGGDTFAGITGGIAARLGPVGRWQARGGRQLLDEHRAGRPRGFPRLPPRPDGRRRRAQQPRRSSSPGKAYEADPYVARIVEAYARMLGNAGRFDEAGSRPRRASTPQGLDPSAGRLPCKATIDLKQRPGVFAANVQAGAAEMFHSHRRGAGPRGQPPRSPRCSCSWACISIRRPTSIDLVYRPVARCGRPARRRQRHLRRRCRRPRR